MSRVFSTATVGVWAGYHGAWAFGLVLSASGHGAAALPFALSLPDTSALPVAGVGVLAAAHAALAATLLRSGVALQRDADMREAELSAFGTLLGGIALALVAALLSLGGGEPGIYALGVALVLAAFHFDRAVSIEAEDDYSDAEFRRAVARISADIRSNEQRRRHG